MMYFKKLLATLMVLVSFFSSAQESATNNVDGYISDDLIIFMHSGAGKNYRILGSINAGEQVQLTGVKNNAYTEVITDKGRTGWVESKHVSETPGLRYAVAELNEKLATIETENNTLQGQLSNTRSEMNNLESERSNLQQQIDSLNIELTETKSQLKNQDTNIKKEWFFNGAIVLGIGLLLGLIVPRLFSRKQSSMSSWN